MKNIMVSKKDRKEKEAKRLIRAATAIVLTAGAQLFLLSFSMLVFLSRKDALTPEEAVMYAVLVVLGAGMIFFGFLFGEKD